MTPCHDPPKSCDRLSWWKQHELEFPRLAQCAKYILAIPASSATSERIFSAGGLTVSNLRARDSTGTAQPSQGRGDGEGDGGCGQRG